jgi:hypothetical protein
MDQDIQKRRHEVFGSVDVGLVRLPAATLSHEGTVVKRNVDAMESGRNPTGRTCVNVDTMEARKSLESSTIQGSVNPATLE